MSLHAHYIEDAQGDLVALTYFCSDACHRDWCEREGENYGGWNGCQERPDYDTPCENCGDDVMRSVYEDGGDVMNSARYGRRQGQTEAT